MQPDITVILPVHNPIASFSQRVEKMFDLLAETADRFELLVVVDGSPNSSVEAFVAAFVELATRFPQLKILRHEKKLGLFTAIRTGCNAAAGKVVYVQEAELPTNGRAIKRFLKSGAPNNLMEVSNRHPVRPIEDELIDRLSRWCVELKKVRSKRRQPAASETEKRIDNPSSTAFPNLAKNDIRFFSNDLLPGQ